MRMMYLAAIGFSMYFSASPKAFAAEYPTCQPSIDVSGKVFALFKSDAYPSGRCWEYVRNGATVKSDDLYASGGSFQFSIILKDEDGSANQYDHVYSVLVRELKQGKEATDPYIDLLRKQMSTLCRKSGSKKIAPYTWDEFSAEFPGYKFNKFHNTSSVTRGRLADFHIAFVNAQKRCVRTDDEEGGYRKTFVIDGVEFPDVPEFRLIANLLRPFQSDSAFADMKSAEFKKYRVRISQATTSRTGMLSVNFYASEGEQSDIKIQDMSENRLGQNLLLAPYWIKVR